MPGPTIIEWFDYALYGAASGLIINKLFFPQMSAVGGTLAAFAAFAVGFFIRPLGGVVISHFGGKFGRKPALIFTIILMGFSTAGMGLLPTYAQFGTGSLPVAVVAMSIAYGIGFAGLAGAQGAFLANLFETRTRFSGIALARELNGLLIGGPTPFIAATLVALGGGSPKLVAGFLMVCCALTVISVLAVRARAVHRSTVPEG